MDKPELLAKFREELEAFEKFHSFIEKAREKADKFRPEVVEKVVRDNTERISAVAEVLNPLVAEMRGVIDQLASDRGGVEAAMEEARLGLEELELRKEIGELEDEAFDVESAGFREALDAAETRTLEIDAELDDFRATLARWVDNRPAASETMDVDVLGGLEDEPVVDTVEEDAFGDDEAFGEDLGRGEGVHVERPSNLSDDVSAVLDDVAATGDDLFMAEDEPVAVDDADDDADGGLSFADDEVADLGGEGLAAAPPFEGTADAVVILGEGTDEEHVFQFGNGVISIGRGRDNTIQVKNDSKVSRYHCKVFVRDAGYYVEDNKSANGTLVDGELITEKRLVGGEEIIVGETFFRFRMP